MPALNRPQLIDLSQEIYTDIPVFTGHPAVTITPAGTHPNSNAPTVHKLELNEHAGTHVDAFNHFSPNLFAQSINTMPLEMFFTEAVCLDLSHKGLRELIEIEDIEWAVAKAGVAIQPKDTVLIYTDHYRRHFGTDNWIDNAGISAGVARWFGELGIYGFGVESRSPGVKGVSNQMVHTICGEMGYTHYENLINLHQLIGKGRFQFIALPLKIRGGTGSPVRAVAIFN
jgi:kynurenine formamidase